MEGIGPGKEIRTFLERKLSLFGQYLSETRRMKEGFTDNKAINLERSLSKRQNLIHKMNQIDSSLEKLMKAGANKLHLVPGNLMVVIETYLRELKDMIETVAHMDREIMVAVRAESEGIKKELLRMRKGRLAARGYRQKEGYAPRFLETRK
ncbi:MAG: hypothetical protein ABII26_09355 [Pseudomonadota bacterium]